MIPQPTAEKKEIALRIFCAILGREDSKIDQYPFLGDKQIRACFAVAETFLRVADELRQDAAKS